MKPVLPVIAHINDSPSFEDAASCLDITPRCLIKPFSCGNAHVNRLFAVLLLGLVFGRGLFGTSIVVRRESDQLIAIAADSKRGMMITPNVRLPPVFVCKVCQIDNGIFLSAGDAELPLCDIAATIARSVSGIAERASEFARGMPGILITLLKRMTPPMFHYYTGQRDMIESVFIGTQSGRVVYGVVKLKAVDTPSGPRIDTTVETCPPACRPYFALGSSSPGTYIENNKASLMSMRALDFVRTVVRETIKSDPSVGGEISSGTIGPFGFRFADAGICHNENSGPPNKQDKPKSKGK